MPCRGACQNSQQVVEPDGGTTRALCAVMGRLAHAGMRFFESACSCGQGAAGAKRAGCPTPRSCHTSASGGSVAKDVCSC